MDQIILTPTNALTFLKRSDADMRLEFVEGIISLLEGKKPKESSSSIETMFQILTLCYPHKVIPGIPRFEPKGMKPENIARYKEIQAGKVPSEGLNHSYRNLVFKQITTLGKKNVNDLCHECTRRIQAKDGSAEYRNFLKYLEKVLKHCVGSGEL